MTDQSVSSCSSNPSTPLSSPPPLPGTGNGTSCRWPNNGSVSHYSFLPHFPTERTNQSVSFAWIFNVQFIGFIDLTGISLDKF